VVFFTGSRDFTRLKQDLPAIQAAIREANLDGWLLFDLHARNNVAADLIGLGELTRRFFVLVPATGEPTAITHGIEAAPWERWPWRRHEYVGWQKLQEVLAETLKGAGTVAMEISEQGAVPAIDLVPAGVVEMVRATGASVVTSGDLVTRFYACWSPAQLKSHRTASAILAQVAQTTFTRIADAVAEGRTVHEAEAREWVLAELGERGFGVGADAIVATGRNAADPHYSPQDGGAAFQRGDVILLDLWSKESEEMVYADQTWMAYLGASVPERAAQLFALIRDARDAAVDFVQRRFAEGAAVRGGDVDDVARGVIVEGGYGEYFIHRTGHSIDRSTHGMGPNIDNLETRDTRLLIPGVGFSIEPGIYIGGEIGLRTEINVYIGQDGPEVTTPQPQSGMTTLLPD
jgi:Xaa-Pro dipeptidase